MSLYFLGIFVAMLIGLTFRKHEYFKTDDRALLIELPPYRIPSIKMITRSAFTRTGEYLKKATTVIMGILIILWALTYFPNHGDTENSYMAKFGKTIAPIMKPTGFGDRWEAVAAIVPSIAAKEIVVGFMAQVLPLKEEVAKNEEVTTFTEDVVEQVKGFGFALKDSFMGIININAIGGLFETPDAETIEEESSGVVGAVANLWAGDKEGPLKAYSFMVFILLVVPCVVTLAAIKQEFGIKFMWFVTGFLVIVPYIGSTLIYQIGRLFI